MADSTVKGSQFKTPLLEFSGSCAGCAENFLYTILVHPALRRQVMALQRNRCSSIWGGPAATSLYRQQREAKGPAWASSLFEDNAEHGLGMYTGQQVIRERLIGKARRDGSRCTDHRLPRKEAIKAFIDTKAMARQTRARQKALIAELEKGAAAGARTAKRFWLRRITSIKIRLDLRRRRMGIRHRFRRP